MDLFLYSKKLQSFLDYPFHSHFTLPYLTYKFGKHWYDVIIICSFFIFTWSFFFNSHWFMIKNHVFSSNEWYQQKQVKEAHYLISVLLYDQILYLMSISNHMLALKICTDWLVWLNEINYENDIENVRSSWHNEAHIVLCKEIISILFISQRFDNKGMLWLLPCAFLDYYLFWGYR